MKEERLIKALSSGDSAALDEIITKYTGYVMTVVRNFSRGALSEEDIDDISAEVFFSLWNYRENLDIKAGLSAYLSAAARNAVKKRFAKLPPIMEDITETDVPSMLCVEEKAELGDMINCLREGLKKLSPRDREIFLRFYLYGERSSEIAKKTGTAENTVKTKLRRARMKLKDFLTERGYDNV